MTDQTNKLPDALRLELLETELLEATLTRVLGRAVPPFGAEQRLQAKLAEGFHESELMLDASGTDSGNDSGPFNFEQAVAAMQRDQDDAASDLLAAGLEEEEIDESIEEESD